MTDMLVIVNYCAQEVHRQGASPLHVGYMFEAWKFALTVTPTDITKDDILTLGDLVNGMAYKRRYRQTPVSFRDGSTGADWWDIPHLMERLLSFQNDATTDEFIKQFLDIHPFEDGNGRTASLLRNIRNLTLGDPEALPYYYGKDAG
jgi:Fic family protein